MPDDMTTLRYFLDFEFIEDGETIDPVSLGIVCEDGRELYLENVEADLSKANDWVRENVFPHMRWDGVTRAEMAGDVLKFVNAGAAPPEFWGYYADYDWVALCQLYGSMVDLPKSWPMFCMDLKQLAVELGNPELPKPDGNEHHALVDARWNRDTFDWLADYSISGNYGLKALRTLEAAGKLGRAFLAPESRYALPGDAGWRLLTVEQARDFMPELLTEIWLRADTLPPLIGEETEEGARDGE